MESSGMKLLWRLRRRLKEQLDVLSMAKWVGLGVRV